MPDSNLESVTLDDASAISLLDQIRAAIADNDAANARVYAYRMLEDDALALLEDLEPLELSRLFVILGDEALAALLARLDERDAARILTRMSRSSEISFAMPRHMAARASSSALEAARLASSRPLVAPVR